jgi:anti-sigma regulatory factor (Ser/Thr protein kinase)
MMAGALQQRPVVDRAPANDWAGSYPLPSVTRSSGLARLLVRQALEGSPAELVDDAQLLVSELVTNAIRHAETGVRLHIDLARPGIRVGVEDGSADPLPASYPVGLPGDGQEHGYGLGLLDTLADAWGWERTAAGKNVWFELR